jgi:hypothetical protein
MAPLLGYFYGIKIEIYSREHLPVHIHAKYGEHEALIDLKTEQVLSGSIPRRKLKKVQEWLCEDNRRALIEKNFFELNPQLLFNDILKQQDEKQ